ncbi:thermonuclease family protein [Candidatus Omnitrophota bacterium]
MRAALLICMMIALSAACAAEEYFEVVRIADGNTIVLDIGDTVYLLGVNSPDITHNSEAIRNLAERSLAFTKKMCAGKRVRLEFDGRSVDKFGRVLAYVYLEDGTFLNAEIIKNGYGQASTIRAFKLSEQFREYEKEARENKAGFWALDDFLLAEKKEPEAVTNEELLNIIRGSGLKSPDETAASYSGPPADDSALDLKIESEPDSGKKRSEDGIVVRFGDHMK